MDFTRFSKIVIGTVVAIVALCAFANYEINFYGLFGDVRGRAYVVWGMERMTKYLFSFNYIPSNFDGVLIGSSISDSWDTGRLHDGRIYNASLNGGNISEGSLIADNIFHRRRLKTVLVVIHPYLTATYGPKSGYMTQKDYWSSFGSTQLAYAYVTKWLAGQGIFVRHTYNAFGRETFNVPRVPIKVVATLNAAPGDFPIEERALAQYRDLLIKARQNGARVVGIVPLRSKSLDEEKGKMYETYNARIKGLFLPHETIIDLNQYVELIGLRTDPNNFHDGIHISSEAADRMIVVLNRALK